MRLTLFGTAFKRVLLPSLAAAALTAAAILAPLPSELSANAEDKALPNRIVAVGGSVTEIVFALGQDHRLVGRDTTSSYPEAAEDLPDVGYMRALSAEGVLSLNPDLVLMLEGAGPPETLEVLQGAGVPMAVIPEDFSAEGVIGKVKAVGTALGSEDPARELSEHLETGFRKLGAARAPDAAPKRVLFILSLNGGKVLASGSGTAADSIIEMAGLTNAVTGFEGYKPLSDEAVIEAAPDVVLMMDRGGNHAVTMDKLKSLPALAITPAVQNAHVVSMDGLFLLGFGPRTAEAVQALADKIDAFSGQQGGKDS